MQNTTRSRPLAGLRVALTLLRVVLHVGLGLLIVGGLFRFRSPAGRARLVRWWSGRVLTICRTELRVTRPPDDGSGRAALIDRALRPGGIGAMLVMNHVSWLDIFVIHSLRPARFVAKAEIARWPLLGWLTERTGALFIERGKRHAVREVNQRAAAMLAAGDLLGMFPEGSVSDGRRLLPFHANLIQPAIDARVPILVAALRYRDAGGGPTDAMYFVGDVTMLQSIVRIARSGPLVCELRFVDALDGQGATRHEVARRARAAIAAALDFDDEADETAEGISTVIVVDDGFGLDARLTPGVALAGTAPGTMLDPRDELL